MRGVFDREIDKKRLIGPSDYSARPTQRIVREDLRIRDECTISAIARSSSKWRKTALTPASRPRPSTSTSAMRWSTPASPATAICTPRLRLAGGANDVPELVDFLRGLFKIGYLSPGEKRPWVGFEIKPQGRRNTRTGHRGDETCLAGSLVAVAADPRGRALAARIWQGARGCATIHRFTLHVQGVSMSDNAASACNTIPTPHFAHWEKIEDLIDNPLDVMLNYRQSGHPGGSRSKVHILVTTMLSGAMRWDIRHPEKRFGDRFVLGAGHTIPLIYCTLAVFNEALRMKHAQTGDSRYAMAGPNARWSGRTCSRSGIAAASPATPR